MNSKVCVILIAILFYFFFNFIQINTHAKMSLQEKSFQEVMIQDSAILNRIASLNICIQLFHYLNLQIQLMLDNYDKNLMENTIFQMHILYDYLLKEIETDPNDIAYKKNLDNLLHNLLPLFEELKLLNYISKIKESSTYENTEIYFRFGGSKLNDKSIQKLIRLSDWLKLNTNIQVIVIGCSDAIGEDQANRIIKRYRAEAVKQFLVTTGISSNRLSITTNKKQYSNHLKYQYNKEYRRNKVKTINKLEKDRKVEFQFILPEEQ